MRCRIAGTQNLKSMNVQEERMICGHENMHAYTQTRAYTTGANLLLIHNVDLMGIADLHR